MSPLEPNKKHIAGLIRSYYQNRPLVEPPFLPKREIAIQPIGSRSYVRHLSFPSMVKLYEYIDNNPPLHLYYSIAVYENPMERDMETKGLIRADLMFDIDADHYKGCSEVVSVCLSCGYVAKESLKECPKCGSKDIVKIPQLPADCIKRAWADVLMLVDILENEFSAGKITVTFSGNRGFHVRVEDDHIASLDRDSRREIADYIALKNIKLERIVPRARIGRKKGSSALFYKDREYGIRARLRDYVVQYMEYVDRGELIEVNYSDLEAAVEALKINIDSVVTMDTSRLSRFIHSINGKAGLVVHKLDPDKDYEHSFDLYRGFIGRMVVQPLFDISEINVLDRRIKLRSGERIRVDAYIGFYLALKGIVRIIDISDVEAWKP